MSEAASTLAIRPAVETDLPAITAIYAHAVSTGTASYETAAVIGAQYSTFTYDFPKITVSSTLQVLPYLTDSGRVRVEFNVQAKREIVRDFYLSLSIFDSYDSRDPSTQQAKNDWGPVLSIGWTF